MKLLFVAKVACKIAIKLLMLSFAALTVVFVHWQIDRDFYSDVPVMVREDANYSKKVEFDINNERTDRKFYMDKLKIESVYSNYFQFTALIYLLFLILKNGIKIISSVESLQTFNVNNAGSFKKVGKLCLAYFILGGITYVQLERGSIFSISIQLTPLIIAIVAFIISDVFKEGNNLLEESTLTI